jgi:hypothetical protein
MSDFWTFSGFLDYADFLWISPGPKEQTFGRVGRIQCSLEAKTLPNQYSQTYFDHHSYMDTKFLLVSETFFCQIVIVEASLLSSGMMFLFSFSALGTRLCLCLFIGHTVSIKFWLFYIFSFVSEAV